MCTLEDFLDRHGIAWQPTHITLEANGKKRPSTVRGVMAKSTDFATLPAAEVLARRSLLPHATHLAIDTTQLAQLDVDSEDAMSSPLIRRLLRDAPYFLSCRKKLPHFFIRLSGKPPKTTMGVEALGKTEANAWRVELLCGKWSWAEKGVQLHNPDAQPPTMALEDFFCKKRPRESDTDVDSCASERPEFTADCRERAERAVRGLSKQRATEYGTWSEVLLALLNVAATHREVRDHA